MKRTAIVKKHPERGVWCLFDSDGKKALNCFKNRYKSKKPPQEAIDRAERIVQFYKHQGADMAVRVASRYLDDEGCTLAEALANGNGW